MLRTVLIVAFALFAQSVQADECDRLLARNKAQIDNAPRRLTEGFSAPIPKAPDWARDRPSEYSAEFTCTLNRKSLQESKENLEERYRIERVCGRRAKWTVCDTACAESAHAQRQKETAELCSTAMMDRAKQEDAANNSARLKRAACGDLLLYSVDPPSSKLVGDKLTTAVKLCSESGHSMCETARDSLIAEKLPIKLTCAPVTK